MSTASRRSGTPASPGGAGHRAAGLLDGVGESVPVPPSLCVGAAGRNAGMCSMDRQSRWWQPYLMRPPRRPFLGIGGLQVSVRFVGVGGVAVRFLGVGGVTF